MVLNTCQPLPICLLCFALVLDASIGQQPGELTPQVLYDRVVPSVVTIFAGESDAKLSTQGSGFIIKADGRFVTNYHVVKNAKVVRVQLSNGDLFNAASVIAIDKLRDIAVLRIPAVDLAALSLGKSSEVQIGQRVYAIGAPRNLVNTITDGIVSAMRAVEGYRLFQISAPISPGSSGGPVLAPDGRVIAIASGAVESGQALNFAIPIDYLRGLLSLARDELSLDSLLEPSLSEGAPTSLSGKEKNQATAPSKEDKVVDQQPSGGSQVPPEAEKDLAGYIVKRLGVWTPQEAIALLGAATSTQESDIPLPVVVYSFGDPSRKFRSIVLAFDKADKSMVSVTVSPWALSRKQLEVTFGSRYNVKSGENGNKVLIFTEQTILATVSADDVVLGITALTPAAFELLVGPTQPKEEPKTNSTPLPQQRSVSEILDSLKAGIGLFDVTKVISLAGAPFQTQSLRLGSDKALTQVLRFSGGWRGIRYIETIFDPKSGVLSVLSIIPRDMDENSCIATFGDKFEATMPPNQFKVIAFKGKPVSCFIDTSTWRVARVSIVKASTAYTLWTGKNVQGNWRLRLGSSSETERDGEAHVRAAAEAWSRGSVGEFLSSLDRAAGVADLAQIRKVYGREKKLEPTGSSSPSGPILEASFDLPGSAGSLIFLLDANTNRLLNTRINPRGMRVEVLKSSTGASLRLNQSRDTRVYWMSRAPGALFADRDDNIVEMLVGVDVL